MTNRFLALTVGLAIVATITVAADQATHVARGIFGGAVSSAKTVARLTGTAAAQAGKAAATRAKLLRDDR